MAHEVANVVRIIADTGKRFHSFHAATEAVRLVKEGKRAFYTQYFLNPSISINNIWFTLEVFVLLILLRFALAGAHHPRLRNIPSVFSLVFGKYAKPKRENKFCENSWYSCWHTFSLIFGIYVLYKEALTAEAPGWTRMLLRELDVKWYWFPTIAEHANGNLGWPLFPTSPLMQAYYLTELAFWSSCLFYLGMETIRDDFYALLLHHVVTCVLIGFSYVCSLWRVGTIVLIVHDMADIVLYSAKAIHYTWAPDYIVDTMFIIFVFTFFSTRLIFFPFFCVRPALECCTDEKIEDVLITHWQVPGGIILPGFLCVLQMLHVFWFGLIVKMLFRKAAVSKAGDIRSDDEDDGSGTDNSFEDEESSVEEADTDSLEEKDQRMKLSSLPGVRATLTRKELRSSPKKRSTAAVRQIFGMRTATDETVRKRAAGTNSRRTQE